MQTVIEKTGTRYGKWTILRKDLAVHGLPKAYWLCRCDCGTIKSLLGSNLRSGKTLQCRSCAKTIHGELRYRNPSGVYKHWRAMINRCIGKNYHNYQGRGIKVCDTWKQYKVFREWAASSGYQDGLTIERLNFNGDYEPSNCIWIPPGRQLSNTRRCVFIVINSQKKCLSDWAKFYGMNPRTILCRHRKRWPEERLFEPIRIRRKGVTKT